jgi:hypothetical protein
LTLDYRRSRPVSWNASSKSAALTGEPYLELFPDARCRYNIQHPAYAPCRYKEFMVIAVFLLGMLLAPTEGLFSAQTQDSTGHWAFQPVRKSVPPETVVDSWSTSPLDRFVLARLQKVHLLPSPMVERRVLLRRAYFDLLGLPPSPRDIAAFEADHSADAYQKLIDRLLASPQYGERWGRHWLDVARYADNKGYVFFEDTSYPWAFTYRDYVISAFNRDLPYDRFVLEQLAADQVAPHDPQALAALGFLTVGGHFMNNTHDIIDDRIDVVTRGLLGLTVTCARCHDHKFDPIPQADYYSLYGVFRSSYEPTVPPLLRQLSTSVERQQDGELRSREKKLVDFVTAKHHELVETARMRVADYLLAAHSASNHPPADEFMLIADRGDLNPAIIARWRQHLADARKRRDPLWGPWHTFAALSEKQFAVRAARWTSDFIDNRLVRETFRSPPKSMRDVADRYGKLLKTVDQNWRDAVKKTTGGKPLVRLEDADAEQLRQVLYGPQSPADAPLALDWGFLSLFPDRATQDEYKKLLKEVETAAAKGPPRVMVLLDSARLYDPHIFERGQPGKMGEPVPRQFLEVVNTERKPFTHGSGRLDLAREVVSRDNPLTARVLVNRIWMHHFGTGLVKTPSDFGTRNDPPSHPELLDYLAFDFMDHGWSIKRLHRQIMTSAVYMQASTNRADGQAIDPENRLLWRMNRRRLEFEALHDAILAVSGGLNTRMHGQPVALFDDHHRRAVYGQVDRLEFPSLLCTFDVPNPATSVPARNMTTVPPQALFMMNGPFTREAARRLANLLAGEFPRKEDRLNQLFTKVFGRKPSGGERELAFAYLDRGPEAERWLELIQGLLMANEFVFVD